MPHGPSDFDDIERAIRRASFATPRATTPCLDAGEFAALIDGHASLDARDRAVSHLSGCAVCRATFADLTETVAGEDVARARVQIDGADQPLRLTSTATGGTRRRALMFTGLAAAALLFVVLRQPVSLEESTTTMRDDGVSAVMVAPAVVSPRGAMGRDASFAWTRINGADLYRVTVFAIDGVVVWEGESPDTTLAMPQVPALRAGETYLWRVQARRSFNRWTSSELVEFRLGEGFGR